MNRNTSWCAALLLMAAVGQATELLETDGIVLHGTVKLAQTNAATCHVMEENYSEEEWERVKANEGQPLHLWRLTFSVENRSGKALDHVIALYRIDSPWPPCTNWDGPHGVMAEWADPAGHIQKTAKPYSVAPGEMVSKVINVVAFHTDTPRFERWDLRYTFADAAGQAAVAAAKLEASASAVRTKQAPGLPPGIQPGDTCEGKPLGAACWLELENQPGCYVWNDNLKSNETATWTGKCSGGIARGIGELSWVYGEDRETGSLGSGHLLRGKANGQWFQRFASGATGEGSFIDSSMTGRWVIRFANGGVAEGPYLDDKRNGQWVIRFANGDVHEGPYVDGKANGQWVLRYANGNVQEGPVVDGKENGQWVLRYANGNVQEGPVVDGKKNGQWVLRFASGGFAEGPYVDDKRNGQWVIRGPDGIVSEGPYVDGAASGRWVTRYPDGTVETEDYEP